MAFLSTFVGITLSVFMQPVMCSVDPEKMVPYFSNVSKKKCLITFKVSVGTPKLLACTIRFGFAKNAKPFSFFAPTNGLQLDLWLHIYENLPQKKL